MNSYLRDDDGISESHFTFNGCERVLDATRLLNQRPLAFLACDRLSSNESKSSPGKGRTVGDSGRSRAAAVGKETNEANLL